MLLQSLNVLFTYPYIRVHHLTNPFTKLIAINDYFSPNFTFETIDLYLAILSGIFGFYLLITLLIMKNSSFPIWVTRKTIHFLGGTFIAFMVNFFPSFWGILLSVSIFVIIFAILVLSSKFELLQEYFILKNCRENERDFTFVFNTSSTLITLFILYFAFSNQPSIFMAGALIISWADTAGEVVGKNVPFVKYKIFNQKTLSGSLAVFLMSLISFVVSVQFMNIPLVSSWFWKILIGSLICTVAEASSWKWLDNIFLPILGSLTMLWVYLA
ncbi:MAG: hypothetical protein ACTSSH_03820 [Candidatus Heimdallarchaeota archaeon]